MNGQSFIEYSVTNAKVKDPFYRLNVALKIKDRKYFASLHQFS